MIQSAASNAIEKSKISSFENKKNIQNHNKIAIQLESAANHHLEAAKHHADGNHEKAAISTIEAQGQLSLANENQKEDVKQHALNHFNLIKPDFFNFI